MNSMDKYLCIGIDPGYKSSPTGIGLVSEGAVVGSFSRHLAGKFPGERIRSFRDLIESTIRDVKRGVYGPRNIGLLVWEEPHARFRTAFRCLSYLEAVLYLVCEDLLVPYVPVNNKTIKEALCESGGVGKAGMLAAAERLSGKVLTDQDEADAILCAFYAEKVFTNSEGMTG